MYERLILCDFAVADLTTANANVFYELGLRHAVRQQSTVMLFAKGCRLPFDVNGLRALPYQLTPDGKPAFAAQSVDGVDRPARGRSARADTDSPLYQLVEDYPNIQREKTDVFRNVVDYSLSVEEALDRGAQAGDRRGACRGQGPWERAERRLRASSSISCSPIAP